jgi:hypothetical protein
MVETSMRAYSIRYLDLLQRQQASDFKPFKDDSAATEFARLGLVQNAVVEVWKNNELVIRLHRAPAAESVNLLGVAPSLVPPAHRPAPDPSAPAGAPRIVGLHSHTWPIK